MSSLEVGLDGGDALDLDTDVLGKTGDLDGGSGGLVRSESLQEREQQEGQLPFFTEHQSLSRCYHTYLLVDGLYRIDPQRSR